MYMYMYIGTLSLKIYHVFNYIFLGWTVEGNLYFFWFNLMEISSFAVCILTSHTRARSRIDRMCCVIFYTRRLTNIRNSTRFFFFVSRGTLRDVVLEAKTFSILLEYRTAFSVFINPTRTPHCGWEIDVQ